MVEELNKLIEEIPEELQGCFGIEISKSDANKLIKEFSNFENKIQFPITYRNIFIAIGNSNTKLVLFKTYDAVFKVFNYEKNKFDKYAKEYEKLCNKHKLSISGCGCCGSPYLENNFHTFDIHNIEIKNKKLKYDLFLNEEYKDVIKEYIEVSR